MRASELLARVALDHRRPFVVRTEHGAVRALGTAFVLRRQADYSEGNVLAARVEVATRDGQRQRLYTGRSARFDHRAISATSLRPEAESAWVDGLLEVDDRPLAQVIAAIRPYRSGLIRVAERAATLRVSGVFPLDDTGLALALLVAYAMPNVHEAAHAKTLPEAVATQQYDIAVGPLSSLLAHIGRQSGQLLSFDADLVRPYQSPAIKGSYTAEQALTQALKDSDLEAAPLDDGVLTIRRAKLASSAPQAATPKAAPGQAVVACGAG